MLGVETEATSKPRSRWRPKTGYRLVVVAWEDSARPRGAWGWLRDEPEPQPIQCVSVGFIVRETDKAVSLTPNLGDIGFETEQGCGTITIPKCAILRLCDL